jgi:hypothetical protein
MEDTSTEMLIVTATDMAMLCQSSSLNQGKKEK